MTKVMLVGDTHGNIGPLAHKIRIAEDLGIKHLFQVGDFGLWPGMGGVVFLDEINRLANSSKVNLWAIPGNHEQHDQWNVWAKVPGLPKMHGFTAVRSHIWLSPKVNFFKFEGKRFGVAGGAVSIDKMWRREGESWWPNEVLSEKEQASLLAYAGPKLDYLLTHDCSDLTDWGFKLVPDPDSQRHRQVIDNVLRHLEPKVHFHGHMHRKYDWVNDRTYGYSAFSNEPWTGPSTQTYGLDCDGEVDSWGVLDTDDDSFVWGRDING